jgi:phosphoglycolate phosphatase
MQHVIFDLDGTLTDPREGITRCWAHAVRELGREPPPLAAMERYIGPPTRDVAGDLLGSDDPGLIERMVTIYRERFAKLGLFENVLFPGIPALLAQLQAEGRSLWVCTSKPEVYALRILEHFELMRFFQHVYGCELDGTRGHKVELLTYLLEREHIRPRSAVMIGDREHDVRAARATDAHSIGVLYGFGSQAELERAGAERICARVEELAATIASFS